MRVVCMCYACVVRALCVFYECLMYVLACGMHVLCVSGARAMRVL